MAVLPANSHLLCRQLHHQDPHPSKLSNSISLHSFGFSSAINSNNWRERERETERKRPRRGSSKAEAFWQGVSGPTSIEMEPITGTDQFDQILSQAKELSQTIIIDWSGFLSFFFNLGSWVALTKFSSKAFIIVEVLSLNFWRKYRLGRKRFSFGVIWACGYLVVLMLDLLWCLLFRMAAWCRKCIYLKPKLEKLAAEYEDKWETFLPILLALDRVIWSLNSTFCPPIGWFKIYYSSSYMHAILQSTVFNCLFPLFLSHPISHEVSSPTWTLSQFFFFFTF